MGKGEIARYEQFRLFPPCFQKQFVVDVYLWSKELHFSKNERHRGIGVSQAHLFFFYLQKIVLLKPGEKKKCFKKQVSAKYCA